MKDQSRELYREFTGWAPWVYLLLWGAVGTAAVFSGSILALLIAGAIHVLLGGLLVTVHTDGVRVGLGRPRLLGSFIPFDDVTRLESVTYRPLREFGGWGLRGSGEKRAWTARGNGAVVLHTVDGRRIYVGSDDPPKLEGRIRNAMGVG